MGLFHNNALIGSSASADVEFETTLIGNSIHMNGEDEHLELTLGQDTGRTRAIIACWLQRTRFQADDQTIYSLESAGSPRLEFAWRFDSNQNISIFDYTRVTSELLYDAKCFDEFRDDAWYHFLLSVDTNADAGDKVQVYVNGIQRTLAIQSGVDYGSAENPSLTSGAPSKWGVGYATSNNQELDCYLAQATFIGGKSIQASGTANGIAITDILNTFKYGSKGSAFGPKANADVAALATAGDADSYCLDFANSGDLGNDISDKGNDFTLVGIDSTNQYKNTPSYMTAHLSDAGAGTEPPALSDAAFKLSAHGNGGYTSQAGSNIPLVEGKKFYWECKYTGALTNGTQALNCGIYNADDETAGRVYFAAAGNLAFYTDNNGIRNLANTLTNYVGEIAEQTSATVGWAVDLSNNWAFVHVNGTYINGTPNFTDGTNNIQASIPSGTWTPYFGTNGGTTTKVWEVNFGESPPGSGGNADDNGKGDFDYDVPAGYVMIDSTQLPTPDYQGIDYFKPVIYTGNGTAIGSGGKPVTGAGFSPDLVWIKNREATDEGHIYDSKRGATKLLLIPGAQGGAAAETTDTEGLTAFDADGFTVGNNVALNTNNEDYVSWNWKAGTAFEGAGSGGAEGSIAASGIKSTPDHFSLISYEGTGANGTVKHGLSAAPEIYITRQRTAVTTLRDWIAGGSVVGTGTSYVAINDDIAVGTEATYWNSTLASDTVISLGSFDGTNGDGDDYIILAFRSIPGVCKVGKYEGNGSNTSGPLVYTGFKPSFLWIRDIDAATDGVIYDTARSSVNEAAAYLYSSVTTVEASSITIDIIANGFIPHHAGGNVNVDGNTIIYIAMAEIGGNGTLPPTYGV